MNKTTLIFIVLIVGLIASFCVQVYSTKGDGSCSPMAGILEGGPTNKGISVEINYKYGYPVSFANFNGKVNGKVGETCLEILNANIFIVKDLVNINYNIFILDLVILWIVISLLISPFFYILYLEISKKHYKLITLLIVLAILWASFGAGLIFALGFSNTKTKLIHIFLGLPSFLAILVTSTIGVMHNEFFSLMTYILAFYILLIAYWAINKLQKAIKKSDKIKKA